MELIKRQKWENLFKRRELVHTDAVKEFYAKMSVIHLKKKDIVKSKVRGVEIEFDHEKLAIILGVPGNNGICEYVKDVWEESKYIKPLEITKGEEPKRYDYFEETFLTMCKLRREDGVWWIGRGENRRRDDDIDVPAEEEAEKEEENQTGFDWEAVIDEAATEGESGSGEKFYDAEDENQGSPEEQEEIPAAETHGSAQQMEQTTSGVDPSGLTGREAEFLKFQAEFERKRANRFHDDLEKAKAENAKLLALLHQAQTKPHP
ncbi:hypothetical protein Dimus_030012 [Dionaea muscipula]